MLNRRFNAADMSFTPRSRVLAVAMIENPRWPATSVASSGTEMRFSDSKRDHGVLHFRGAAGDFLEAGELPASIARKIGLLIRASGLGPWAISMA